MKRVYNLLVVVAAVLSITLWTACSDTSQSNPKDVVIEMFGAMEKNDKARLAHLLDLSALMKNINQDYALSSIRAREFSSPEDILNDLTGDGQTKKRWFSMQRIIDQVDVKGNTATVDVTFVDKERSRGYRTKFGLHIVHDKWKIFSFKTVPSSP